MDGNCKLFNGRALTETAAIMKIQTLVRLLWIELEGHMQTCLWKAMTETKNLQKRQHFSRFNSKITSQVYEP